ncbi:MAG: hypothetical protein WDN69_15125 [Aliidongia sp.]
MVPSDPSAGLLTTRLESRRGKTDAARVGASERCVAVRLRPNVWDAVALPIVLGFLALMAYAGEQSVAPFQLGQQMAISLDPTSLPEYAMRTVLRMAIALVVSLCFSLTYAALAAKSRQAENC